MENDKHTIQSVSSQKEEVPSELPVSTEGSSGGQGPSRKRKQSVLRRKAACLSKTKRKLKKTKCDHDKFRDPCEKLNLLANQLGYLGKQDPTIIITTLEQQNRDLEVVFEDIARMEGLLAKKDFNITDPHLLASARKAEKNYNKVSSKHSYVMKLARAIEKVGMHGQRMCGRLSTAMVTGNDSSKIYTSFFPMVRQYQKIFQEVKRRSFLLSGEFNRRVLEFENW